MVNKCLLFEHLPVLFLYCPFFIDVNNSWKPATIHYCYWFNEPKKSLKSFISAVMVVFACNHFMCKDLTKIRNFKVSLSHYNCACGFYGYWIKQVIGCSSFIISSFFSLSKLSTFLKSFTCPGLIKLKYIGIYITHPQDMLATLLLLVA